MIVRSRKLCRNFLELKDVSCRWKGMGFRKLIIVMIGRGVGFEFKVNYLKSLEY